MSRESPTLDEQYGLGAEMNETIAAHREQIADDIMEERERQDRKWGGAEHDDRHSVTDFVTYINNYTAWAHQMALSGSLPKARRRLIQVAALAAACVEAIDRALARVQERACRSCGCTDLDVCQHDDGRPCSWVSENLCSVCFERRQARAEGNRDA